MTRNCGRSISGHIVRNGMCFNHEHQCQETCVKNTKNKLEALRDLKKRNSVPTCRFWFFRILSLMKLDDGVLKLRRVRRRGKPLVEEPYIETSADRNRMPFLFTVGTGAVNRAIDDAVRGMKPGGTRRLVVPAKFDKGIDEEVYVQMRLRAIKGTSSFNICAVPPNGRVTPSVFCQEGARPDVP